jgi:hypothetical protein
MTAAAVQWAERIMRRIDGTFPTEYHIAITQPSRRMFTLTGEF